MTDDENTTPESYRPNANYSLSRPDNRNQREEENLTFHYSRERRLAKAPQSVKNLYKDDKKHSRFNLLRPLIADKPRATLFFTIVVISIMIFMITLLGLADKSYLLEGNKLEISGTRYEDVVIVIVKKSINSAKSCYFGAVEIAVSPVVPEGEEFPVFYHRVIFNPAQEEEYRFAVPFNSGELAMVFQTEKTALKFRMKPE